MKGFESLSPNKSHPLSMGLEAPSKKEMERSGEQSEVAELEQEIETERYELSEFLAQIYDEADELGIQLDNAYAGAGDEDYQIVRDVLLDRRARVAMMLEEVEEKLERLAAMRGKSRISEV